MRLRATKLYSAERCSIYTIVSRYFLNTFKAIAPWNGFKQCHVNYFSSWRCDHSPGVRIDTRDI
jgi:hypothetical protein